MKPSSNKETKELLSFPALSINGIYKSLKDGAFKIVQDFPSFLPAFLSIESGVKGIKEVKDENVNMSIEHRVDLRESLFDMMTDVDLDDRWDITEGMSGVLSLFRLGWRKGHQKGREDLIEELKNGTTKLEDLV